MTEPDPCLPMPALSRGERTVAQFSGGSGEVLACSTQQSMTLQEVRIHFSTEYNLPEVSTLEFKKQ